MPRNPAPMLRGLITVASLLLTNAISNAQDAKPAPPGEHETWVNPESRKVSKYELGRNKLAIEGYDPVAYFPEGGGKALKGKKDFELTHRGVLYRFASAEHLKLFKENPDKYEPTHGGWCAYAMAKGDYTEPNPKRFLIQNDRLMLFYDGIFGDTYKMWFDEGPEQLEKEADVFWQKESGEKPRIPAEFMPEESAETKPETGG